jgi:hypothetical protein
MGIEVQPRAPRCFRLDTIRAADQSRGWPLHPKVAGRRDPFPPSPGSSLSSVRTSRRQRLDIVTFALVQRVKQRHHQFGADLA